MHSAAVDARGHRLEKQFGHPALHAKLTTPKLNEYGRQEAEAKVVAGIKIAGIEQVCLVTPISRTS